MKIPQEFGNMSLGGTAEQVSVTTPTIFAAASQTSSHGYSNEDIYQVVKTAVITTSTPTFPTPTSSSSTRQQSSEAWNLPPTGGWEYCWSHGGLRSKRHNSSNCTNIKTGHKRDTTLQNNMSGTTSIWRNRNDRE
mmetsp:Transcript_19034/g.22731  ORF Transcript_19034/g.22731 Transcript_19034/m.22731 type:complete len:135 (-) Transcript_19034:36-440(-)